MHNAFLVLASIVTLITIVFSPYSHIGIQDSGEYRVTDRASHIEMCLSDFVPNSAKADCLSDAENSWK